MKRILVPLFILGLIAAGIWHSIQRARPSDVVSGTLESDEAQIGSKVGGRVMAIHGQEGDSLKKDQPVLDFDDSEMKAHRDAAIAAVAAAQAQWEELQHGPLALEIEQARKTWQSAQASTELARKNQERTHELFASKATSAEELDHATKQLEALEAQAAAAQANFQRLQEGTRPEKLAQARAELEQLKARLAEAEAQLRETHVIAPADATIEILQVKQGDIVAPNRPVATLRLAGALWVRVYVRGEWLGKIAVGDKIRLRVDAFPDEIFIGKVIQLASKAEFTPRNVQTADERARQLFAVKIQFPETETRLRAGMTAETSFIKP